MNEDTLPDKLSELLKVALADFDQVRQMPERFMILMNLWHAPMNDDSHCAVCLAGAVMAMTLKMPDNEELAPSSFPPEIQRKLRALDNLRQGHVIYALDAIGRHDLVETLPATLKYFRVHRYDGEDNHQHARELEKSRYTRWRADMDRLITQLEEVNL